MAKRIADMMDLDLTLTKFRTLCAAAVQNYTTLTLAEYFESAAPHFAIMRHDIDRRAGRALGTARIDHQLII